MDAHDAAVFVGSSSEGKHFAEYLQAALDAYCESTIWDQGVFGLSQSGLQALVSESQRVDYAILVLTPDDMTTKREVGRPSARDNVIFETGLFLGALGAERTIIVRAGDLELDLPSDLAGITTCSFRSQRADSNLRAALNPVALQIREVIERHGRRNTSNRGLAFDARAPEAPQWNRETILRALSARMGTDRVAIAKHLFSWADAQPGVSENFGRGVKDGSWQVGYPEEDRYLWPFVLYTYGRIEIQFQHIAKRPPFDDEALRDELRAQLNALPSVRLSEQMLKKRPSIDLLSLASPRALREFTDTMEWAFRQADLGPGSA